MKNDLRKKIIDIIGASELPIGTNEILEKLDDDKIKYGTLAVFLYRMEAKEKSIIRPGERSGYVLIGESDKVMNFHIGTSGLSISIPAYSLRNIWKGGFNAGIERSMSGPENDVFSEKIKGSMVPACERLWRKAYVYGRKL